MTNFRGQSDCEILESVVSQEQQGQSARFFACSDALKEDKRWFENFQFGVFTWALGQSDCRIPESTISQVRIDQST